jgi:hypothetical protein
MSSDTYADYRCLTCGISWKEHTTDTTCARYAPWAEPGTITDRAVAANLPGGDKPRTMVRYPSDVCPVGKTPPPLLDRGEPVVPHLKPSTNGKHP